MVAIVLNVDWNGMGNRACNWLVFQCVSLSICLYRVLRLVYI